MPDSKKMAYGGNDGGTDSSTYRLERGKEYTRAGKIVQAIPQFKGLYLYQQAAGSVPKDFQVSMSPKRVRWPVPQLPNVSSGS